MAPDGVNSGQRTRSMVTNRCYVGRTAKGNVVEAGDIKLMPGTASDAAYRRIDVDPVTGKVVGLF